MASRFGCRGKDKDKGKGKADPKTVLAIADGKPKDAKSDEEPGDAPKRPLSKELDALQKWILKRTGLTSKLPKTEIGRAARDTIKSHIHDGEPPSQQGHCVRRTITCKTRSPRTSGTSPRLRIIHER